MVFDELPTKLATTSGLISLGYNGGFVASYAVNIGDSVDQILDELDQSLLANGSDLARTPTGIELFDPIGIDQAGIGPYDAIGLRANFELGTFDVASPGTLALLLVGVLPLLGTARRKRKDRKIPPMSVEAGPPARGVW